jgi:hypothetical protein
MGRFSRSLSISAVILAVAPGLAQAQSCTSAAKVAGDIYQKVGTEAVALGCSAIKIAFGKDDTFDQKDLLECYKDASFYTGLIDSLTGWWNTKVANNEWSTLGPRRFTANTDHDGTLLGTSGRMFITFPMKEDNATILISERDGRAKTSVVICKHYPDGKWSQLSTRWFNESNDMQKKENEVERLELTGVKGSELSLSLDGKSFTNSFSYTVRVEN